MREAREQLVLDILQDAWVAGNTYDLTPKITFGWFDDKPDGQPAITIQPQRESPIGGGDTTYSGIGGGQSLHQEVAGIVPVHCWCGIRDLDNATTKNPRQYLHAVIEEVRRIIESDPIEPVNPSSGNQPVRIIAPADSNPVPEPDKRGMFHHMINVAYIYGTG